MATIKKLTCNKILDSRGDWTIATTIHLSNGVECAQTIPQGASVGENEAFYVPVDDAARIVSTVINDLLVGKLVTNQSYIDNLLISFDGTPNKHFLGGNSILSVSLAVAKSASITKNVPLYEYLSVLYNKDKIKKLIFPTPIFNILNGGKHASNNLSFQEFMVIPDPTLSFDKKMQMGVTVYSYLEEILKKDKLNTGVGDEGGFAPEGLTVTSSLNYIRDSIKKKYILGKDVFIGMDVAAGSFYRDKEYFINEENARFTAADLMSYYKKLLKKYPIIYVEDPFYEGDIDGWREFYKEYNKDIMIVADDLVVTNPLFLNRCISNNLANSVIVKPNQVGTLTETLEFIRIAKKHKMAICVSHRSGDTAEDTFIADIAIAVGADFIKSGSPVRGERVAKYNRLLDIFYDNKDS